MRADLAQRRVLVPGRSVTVEVPATSANVGPGFDCFGLALDWRERVNLAVIEDGYRIEVSGEGAAELPRAESHLLIRAVLVVSILVYRPQACGLTAATRFPTLEAWDLRRRPSSQDYWLRPGWRRLRRDQSGCWDTPMPLRVIRTMWGRRSTAIRIGIRRPSGSYGGAGQRASLHCGSGVHPRDLGGH
jgi:hypothetical protein